MLGIRKCFILSPPFNIVLQRSVKTRVPTKRRTYTLNPNSGVRNQVDAMKLDAASLKNEEDLLENLEKSFWDVDEVYNTNEKEKRRQKHIMSIFQTKRKYFKADRLPNMLTYAEKEEIRALHAENPEHWTVMRLAHSFPATPTIIMKILKNNWKARSVEEIEKHDIRVHRNWEYFHCGKLEIANETLKRHLLTFSPERKPLNQKQNLTDLVVADPPILKKKGPFSNIYESYIKLKGDNSTTLEVEKNLEDPITKGLSLLHYPPENDTFIIPRKVHDVKIRTQKLMTLDKMQERVLNEKQNSETVHCAEEEFVAAYTEGRSPGCYSPIKDPVLCNPESFNKSQTQAIEETSFNGAEEVKSSFALEEHVISLEESDDNLPTDSLDIGNIESSVEPSVATKVKTVHQRKQDSLDDNESGSIVTKIVIDPQTAVSNYFSQSHENYPLRISVPKEVWKKGTIYRVKDCFYSDDGFFLYRVPGLL